MIAGLYWIAWLHLSLGMGENMGKYNHRMKQYRYDPKLGKVQK